MLSYRGLRGRNPAGWVENAIRPRERCSTGYHLVGFCAGDRGRGFDIGGALAGLWGVVIAVWRLNCHCSLWILWSEDEQRVGVLDRFCANKTFWRIFRGFYDKAVHGKRPGIGHDHGECSFSDSNSRLDCLFGYYAQTGCPFVGRSCETSVEANDYENSHCR